MLDFRPQKTSHPAINLSYFHNIQTHLGFRWGRGFPMSIFKPRFFNVFSHLAPFAFSSLPQLLIQPETVYERVQYQFEDDAYDTVPDLITFYVGSGEGFFPSLVVVSTIKRLTWMVLAGFLQENPFRQPPEHGSSSPVIDCTRCRSTLPSMASTAASVASEGPAHLIRPRRCPRRLDLGKNTDVRWDYC